MQSMEIGRNHANAHRQPPAAQHVPVSGAWAKDVDGEQQKDILARTKRGRRIPVVKNITLAWTGVQSA
jgi:hypothetical protein